ncbi:MAG TPA: patatin-like phospholipase family protein [Thermoanaerobaculia bacterium]|nr:patatin-like phospholipase family protein [Thermoanaerobaculia bacterium]
MPLPETERQGIGLCLSGAGFRAALFHIGALRRLDELRILGKVWTISSTSGGCIAAAHLATRLRWPVPEATPDWGDYVTAPLREFARARLRPRRRPMSERFDRWFRPERETDRLTKAFERGLTRLLLRDLPSLPIFVFAGADPTDPSLARAVASTTQRFTGDHLAIEPVWRDHQTILVSDGGGLFDRDAAMEQEARALGKRWLLSSFKTGILKGTYWGIESARSRYDPGDRLGYSKRFAKTVLSSISGGLDGLSGIEANVLENHGYLVADAAVETHMPELVAHPAPPLAIPHPDWMDESRSG